METTKFNHNGKVHYRVNGTPPIIVRAPYTRERRWAVNGKYGVPNGFQRSYATFEKALAAVEKTIRDGGEIDRIRAALENLK